MEEKEEEKNPKAWLIELDKKLEALGAKRGNFLKDKTRVYIPKKKD